MKLNSRPTDNVTVTVTSNDPSVATVSPKVLTFSPSAWKNRGTVTVTGVDNDVDDIGDSRSAILTHTISGGDYGSDDDVAIPPVTVTVTDDDDGGLTVTPTSLVIEEGKTDTFTVRLNTEPPLEGVEVTARAINNTVVEVLSPSSRTFTPDNWNVPREFTVFGKVIPDNVHAGGERGTGITISAAAGYTHTPAIVDVTVTDEDVVVAPAGLMVTSTSLTIPEGRTRTYTVKPTTRPRGTVTVTAASEDTNVATVSPPSLTFTSANWETAQTFTVTAPPGRQRQHRNDHEHGYRERLRECFENGNGEGTCRRTGLFQRRRNGNRGARRGSYGDIHSKAENSTHRYRGSTRSERRSESRNGESFHVDLHNQRLGDSEDSNRYRIRRCQDQRWWHPTHGDHAYSVRWRLRFCCDGENAGDCD